MVRPFLGSDTVTSLAFPVRDPSGSPLACASAEGTGRLFLICFIRASPLFPDCLVDVRPVEQTENAEQADRQPEKHHNQPPAYRGSQGQAEQANYESEEGDDYSNENHVSV